MGKEKDKVDPSKEQHSSKESKKDSSFNLKITKKFTPKKKNSFLQDKNQISKLNKEIDELKKSYRYLQAEFANYKKNSHKEIKQSEKFASFSFLKDFLLNVLNDFNRAMEKDWKEKDLKNFKVGIDMLHSKLVQVLGHHGVQEINPPKGSLFDPHVHEVMSVQENKEYSPDVILQVCRKGYELHGRLVQPAQVVVNSAEKRKEE